MTDDLTIRIRRILERHIPIEIGVDFVDCSCGRADFTPKISYADHLADVLVAELDELIQYAEFGRDVRAVIEGQYPTGSER